MFQTLDLVLFVLFSMLSSLKDREYLFDCFCASEDPETDTNSSNSKNVKGKDENNNPSTNNYSGINRD